MAVESRNCYDTRSSGSQPHEQYQGLKTYQKIGGDLLYSSSIRPSAAFSRIDDRQHHVVRMTGTPNIDGKFCIRSNVDNATPYFENVAPLGKWREMVPIRCPRVPQAVPSQQELYPLIRLVRGVEEDNADG